MGVKRWNTKWDTVSKGCVGLARCWSQLVKRESLCPRVRWVPVSPTVRPVFQFDTRSTAGALRASPAIDFRSVPRVRVRPTRRAQYASDLGCDVTGVQIESWPPASPLPDQQTPERERGCPPNRERQRSARHDQRNRGERRDAAAPDAVRLPGEPDSGHMPGRAEVLVLPALQHLHLPGRTAGGARVEGVRVPVLPQGNRVRPQWSQAEGAEGGAPGQAGVRGHFHDGGQGLGGGADFWTDHHRPNPGESFVVFTSHVPTVSWFYRDARNSSLVSITQTSQILLNWLGIQLYWSIRSLALSRIFLLFSTVLFSSPDHHFVPFQFSTKNNDQSTPRLNLLDTHTSQIFLNWMSIQFYWSTRSLASSDIFLLFSTVLFTSSAHHLQSLISSSFSSSFSTKNHDQSTTPFNGYADFSNSSQLIDYPVLLVFVDRSHIFLYFILSSTVIFSSLNHHFQQLISISFSSSFPPKITFEAHNVSI